MKKIRAGIEELDRKIEILERRKQFPLKMIFPDNEF